jgi:hypothetical protein
MNSKFLNEAKELEKRWDVSMLSDISDKYVRSTAAINLECQRLHNETGTWDCCDECKEREAKEKPMFFVAQVVIHHTPYMDSPLAPNVIEKLHTIEASSEEEALKKLIAVYEKKSEPNGDSWRVVKTTFSEHVV